jgi:nicotinamide-nucleotide amidase
MRNSTTHMPANGATSQNDELHRLLLQCGMTVSVAESCTGGLLGAHLTSQPGSSAYFLGAVVAYSNSVKREVLEVPPQLIEEHGAVSAQVALAMANGARKVIGSDLTISVTGIAGPDGGTDEKPVGTTYLGFAAPDTAITRPFHCTGSRAEIREQAVEAALEILRSYLEMKVSLGMSPEPARREGRA